MRALPTWLGRPVVVVEFHGRLGNQLFQFATGFDMARRHGAELLFYDPNGVTTTPGGIKGLLKTPFAEASERQLLALGTYAYRTPLRRQLNGGLRRAVAWHAQWSPRPRFVFENQSGYGIDLQQRAVVPPVLLFGYFQQERYFAASAEQIAGCISLPRFDRQLSLESLKPPIVAVTFRRGDYLDLGWALPLSYYESALAALAARGQIGTIVVFADDPEFASLVVPRLAEYGRAVLGASPGVDAHTQLAMIAHCDHHVMANSTFSWWGAWLSERYCPLPERIVVAPSPWVFGGHKVIPERWTYAA